MTSTRLLDFTGHAGKFRSTVEGPQGRQPIDYGVVVIATGGGSLHRPGQMPGLRLVHRGVPHGGH